MVKLLFRGFSCAALVMGLVFMSLSPSLAANQMGVYVTHKLAYGNSCRMT